MYEWTVKDQDGDIRTEYFKDVHEMNSFVQERNKQGLKTYSIEKTKVIKMQEFEELPRGVRNNNPGNIRITSDKWLGKSEVQTDTEFFQFDHAFYGLRALARLLINYTEKHALVTIEDIISRYAPSNENNTKAYIDFVARNMRVRSDAILTTKFSKENYLRLLMHSIITLENGGDFYGEDIIKKAIKAAE